MNCSKAGLPASPATTSPVTLVVACEGGIEELEATLRGPGMPLGLRSVTRAGDELQLEIDATVTSPSLVRAVVDIEARRFGTTRIRMAGVPALADSARVLSEAIAEPALDERRIIETHLAAFEEQR